MVRRHRPSPGSAPRRTHLTAGSRGPQDPGMGLAHRSVDPGLMSDTPIPSTSLGPNRRQVLRMMAGSATAALGASALAAKGARASAALRRGPRQPVLDGELRFDDAARGRGERRLAARASPVVVAGRSNTRACPGRGQLRSGVAVLRQHGQRLLQASTSGWTSLGGLITSNLAVTTDGRVLRRRRRCRPGAVDTPADASLSGGFDFTDEPLARPA